MLRKQIGFTLIELVMVIVILGILAAVAIPSYINLTNDATGAANAGYIGSLRSGIAMQFSQELLRGVSAPDVIGTPATTITAIEALVTTALPSTLAETPGACGTGKLTGVGKLPGQAPVAGVVWTLTCAAAGAPMTIVSVPANY